MIQILTGAESLLLAFGIGATVWFFFVQTPALLKGMGMERFLPLQIRLVRVYAPVLAVASALVLAAATARVGIDASLWAAALAAGAALLNAWVVVPRAVRAGGQAIREVRTTGESTDDLGSFASTGGGTPTKVWHRLVVVMVLLMTTGMVADGAQILGFGTMP